MPLLDVPYREVTIEGVSEFAELNTLYKMLHRGASALWPAETSSPWRWFSLTLRLCWGLLWAQTWWCAPFVSGWVTQMMSRCSWLVTGFWCDDRVSWVSLPDVWKLWVQWTWGGMSSSAENIDLNSWQSPRDPLSGQGPLGQKKGRRAVEEDWWAQADYEGIPSEGFIF